MLRRLMLVCLIAPGFLRAAAQSSTNDSLVASAIRADSILWRSYNDCDVKQMMQYIAHDIEFYHDKGGITFGDSAFEASIRNRLCSDQGKFRLRRQVVEGTAAAHPMAKDGRVYGVLMVGKHLFYLSQNGQKEYADGLAQFADLWLLRDGQWKMARVFSYDHGPAPYISERKAVTVSQKVLQSLAGNYKGANNSLTVSIVENNLMISLGKEPSPIFAENENLFFARERDLTFEFIRENKLVKKLIVRERGNVVEELQRVR